MILSDDELVVLTRRTRYTAQRRALDAIGVPYRVRPDGSPIVLAGDLDREPSSKARPRSPELRFPAKLGRRLGA